MFNFSTVRFKFTELLQSHWVEKKREERPMEFAPPPAYSNASAAPVRHATARHQYPPPPSQAPKEPSPEPRPILDDESITAGLAFMKNMFPVSSGIPAATPPARPDNVASSQSRLEEEEDDDDDLLPPGESPESSSYRPTHRSGAAIPPPTSMDYYNNTNAGRRVASKRIDVAESFRQGLENRK